MAKFTDAIRDGIKADFNTGDQPTEANFHDWIDAIQQGIEEHDHDGSGDGDGIANLTGLESLTLIYDQDNAEIHLTSHKTAAAGSFMRLRRSRGTEAVPLVVADNDLLGAVLFQGYSAAAGTYRNAAAIYAYIDGVPDSGADPTDMPGRLVLMTTPDGSSTLAPGITILKDSSVLVASLTGGGNIDVFADNTGKLIPDPSDRKLKSNIESLTGGLEVIRALRGVTYNWNKEALAGVDLDFGEPGLQVGLIAQEVTEVIPLASRRWKNYESYSKSMITPYLIEAIKEIDARLTEGGL